MVLPKEICLKVQDFSDTERHDDLVIYLNDELNKKTVTAEAILKYARDYYFDEKTSKRYVIIPSVINQLGVVISSMEDEKESGLKSSFYQLAAKRGDSWGARNYAQCLLADETSAKKALKYAKKAVELSENIKDEVHEHKFILCQALIENKQYTEAYIALLDYIEFKIKAFSSDKDPDIKKDLKEAIEFLNRKVDKSKSIPLSRAWMICCSKILDDKNLPFYKNVMNIRKALLQKQIDVFTDTAVNISSIDLNEPHIEKEKAPVFLLPQDMSSPLNFHKHWTSEATWFDSADEREIKAEYEEKSYAIDKLIEAEKDKNEQENLFKLKNKLEAYYEDHLSQERHVLRRHAAEVRFFNPLRSKKKEAIVDLVKKIIDHRFSHDENNKDCPIKLEEKSARLFNSVENLFQKSLIALGGQNLDLGIPISREKPWYTEYSAGTTTYGPIEYYQVGETKIQSEHRVEPKRQRLGDSFLPEHGSYSKDIYPFLSKLSEDNIEKEKQLAVFMIRYGKTHQPVRLEELQAIYEKADKADVDHFNRICFLIMEKEQAQWHSATQKDYQMGMTVAQARCLLLIREGLLSFKETFKNDVLFGVYSQTGIINSPEKVKKSCQYIEDLYLLYLQNKNQQEYMHFFKKHIQTSAKPIAVLTRKQAHKDLKEVYGGDSDTDGEGYDSDLELSDTTSQAKPKFS